jgi:hypothetical protein
MRAPTLTRMPHTKGRDRQKRFSPSRAELRNGMTWSVPVVLFDDGWAAPEARRSLLSKPIESRTSQPQLWTRWREGSKRYEILGNGSWKEPPGGEYAPLP